MDHYLIDHCAPTLASLKTANMFRVSFNTRKELSLTVRRWNKLLYDKGIVCFCLNCRDQHSCESAVCRQTALIYVVRLNKLKQDLSDPAVCDFLSSYGYSGKDAVHSLLTLREHIMQSDSFPHEIGIFLGYPLADVKGFISNHGQNCICCGDWKVYENPEYALRTFERYRKCKRIYRQLWEQGRDIRQLTVGA